MNVFRTHKLFKLLCGIGAIALSTQAVASGFQLFEQDGGTIGNYHAGYAAGGEDASTAFYNPAGLTQFKNQQIVVAGIGIVTSAKYTGTMAVNTINANTPFDVSGQGGVMKALPAFHMVSPLNDKIAFGFSVTVPFGLATDYGKSTRMRYAATESSVKVIDVSPVLAYKFNDKLSFGAGPDFQYMEGEFDQVGVLGASESDSDGINKADGKAWGYHAGVLYRFNENTRVGMSYHSQVVHHLTGTSKLTGPLADVFGGPIVSNNAKLNVTLPAYTALSAFHKVNEQLSVMGTVIYTQWNSIQELTLQNLAGIGQGPVASTNITATLPEHFKNTFNFSVGANYVATDTVTLKAGLGFDQTPVREAYRNIRLPDNDRYVVALGTRIKTTKTTKLDLSWTHLFINKAKVNPPTQVTGNEEVTMNGHVRGGADVFGAQVVWDIL